MRGGRGEDLVLSSSRNRAQRQQRAETSGYFRSQGSRLVFRSQAAGSFRSRELLGRTSLGTVGPSGVGSGFLRDAGWGGKKGVNLELSRGSQRPIATSSWARPGRERATLGRRASPRDRGSRLRYREASPGLEALWLPGRFGCGHGHGLSSAGEQRPPDCGGGGDREDCLLVARSFSVHRANASRAHAFFGSPTPISAATGKRSAGGSRALAGPRPLRSA